MNRPDGHCGAVSSSTASSASGPARSAQRVPADDLVAPGAPAAAGVRVAPALVLVAVDGVGLDAGPDVGDDLLGQAAVGGGERLPLALGGVGRLGEGDALDRARRPGRRPGGRRSSSRAGPRTGPPRAASRTSRGPAGGRRARPVAERGGAGPGDADRLGRDPVGLGRGQDVRRREAPGAVDEDPDPEALALAGGDAFDPSGLDRDALLEPPDDADVGVPGALGGWPYRGRGRSGLACAAERSRGSCGRQ